MNKYFTNSVETVLLTREHDKMLNTADNTNMYRYFSYMEFYFMLTHSLTLILIDFTWRKTRINTLGAGSLQISWISNTVTNTGKS